MQDVQSGCRRRAERGGGVGQGPPGHYELGLKCFVTRGHQGSVPAQPLRSKSNRCSPLQHTASLASRGGSTTLQKAEPTTVVIDSRRATGNMEPVEASG
jgi:hypothetical protein